jgi:uncharacterized LabA/DUF88 family protein
VYVDGFNLYHAIDDLQKPHLKWVNLWTLSEKLLREGEILCGVKYFTAYATWREESYRLHQRYVEALMTQGVVPVLGHFKAKTVRCQAVCQKTYKTHEEKETDVNIGIHIIADAVHNRFDRALIISADTDLNPVVQLARIEEPSKYIDIVAPPGRKNRNSAALFAITTGKVASSLLPEIVMTKEGKKIQRPDKYELPV